MIFYCIFCTQGWIYINRVTLTNFLTGLRRRAPFYLLPHCLQVLTCLPPFAVKLWRFNKDTGFIDIRDQASTPPKEKSLSTALLEPLSLSLKENNDVKYETPQGSVLGPLLFSLHIPHAV